MNDLFLLKERKKTELDDNEYFFSGLALLSLFSACCSFDKCFVFVHQIYSSSLCVVGQTEAKACQGSFRLTLYGVRNERVSNMTFFTHSLFVCTVYFL